MQIRLRWREGVTGRVTAHLVQSPPVIWLHLLLAMWPGASYACPHHPAFSATLKFLFCFPDICHRDTQGAWREEQES